MRAVLFDLDGTLADTLDDLADSVNAVLAARGFPVHVASSYKRMVGNGMRTLIARVLPEAAKTDSLLDTMSAEASAEYARNILVKTRPYPGVENLLTRLATLKIPFAVLSNKPDPLAIALVAGLFPRHRFAEVRGERPPFPTKPDPASALDIAKILGFPVTEIIYVGDSDVDMQTARNAGMFSAGASWGFRGKDELIQAGAGCIIDRPEELLRYL